MTMNIHKLNGCSPRPLAHYLKALGVFRLVAEQKDPDVRGWWSDESFHIAAKLDASALADFFLKEYAPSPLMRPWSSGSDFFSAKQETLLSKLLGSPSLRFASIKDAVSKTTIHLKKLDEAVEAVRKIKDEAKYELDGRKRARAQADAFREDPAYKKRLRIAEAHFKTIKDGQIASFRKEWRGLSLLWIDSVVTIAPDGSLSHPSLLGTGGNDGRNDFTKQFMECLGLVLDLTSADGAPTKESHSWLAASLFAEPQQRALIDLPVGQFDPGTAGGANMSAAFGAPAFANPWDYILMLEGTLLFLSAITKKSSTASIGASAPFAMPGLSAGYASASAGEKPKRGEQWMPLWGQPATLRDLQQLLSSGRAQLGRKTASRPVDFARAVARLGVARGVTAFERYGYLERNGQSNLAIPLGRWFVQAQPRQELIDDLDRGGWLDSIRRAAQDGNAPNAFVAEARRLDEAVLAACARGGEAVRWQALLMALADLERQLVSSGKFTAEKRLAPIPPLSQGWLEAAGDGSSEYRLAIALARQAANEKGHTPVRKHWMPLEKGRFATDGAGLKKDPDVVCSGADLVDDLIALVRRRLIAGASGASTRLPLVARPRCESFLSDIAQFLADSVDHQRLDSLARAFMSIKWATGQPNLVPNISRTPDLSLYALFRLACLPWDLTFSGARIPIRCDPAVVARLASGDLTGAGQIAVGRLRAAGVTPKLRHVAGSADLARKLAASLAFPISRHTASGLAEMLTKPLLDNQQWKEQTR